MLKSKIFCFLTTNKLKVKLPKESCRYLCSVGGIGKNFCFKKLIIIRNKSNYEEFKEEKEEEEYINLMKTNLNERNERPTFNYFSKKSSDKKFGGKEILAILFMVISWSIFLFPVQIKLLLWEKLEEIVENELYDFEKSMEKMKEKLKENN
uniref:Uncharacterized protein n=1 Tax=Meloidogyne enterolobii TaxID=390850 RepID=A0A6V7Y9I8_MELEN|nr:unnamed protein product [Meloidogyne enterolobii]